MTEFAQPFWGNWGYTPGSITDMDDIIGKTPIHSEKTDEQITFWFSDGMVARWHHNQDCCESVYVEDVTGDWADLMNTPLLVAEERSEEKSGDDCFESNTWTFYTFRSVKGSVDVRWHGQSNGYYSESVDFQMLPAPVATGAA